MLVGCGDPYKLTASNIAYGSNSAQVLDIYEPRGNTTGLRPVIIAIHGGAWQSGDKVWGKSVAERFAGYGYVVVSINYRLAPEHRWPAQIDDCQAALNYLRSNSIQYNIDPVRIGAFGHSAGGHLASMLALRPNPYGDPAVCAVTANGESDLTVYGTEPIMGNEDQILEAILGSPPWDLAILQDFSPTRWVQFGSNPVWVVHSTGDTNVFFSQGQRMATTLTNFGVPSGFTIIRSDSHNSAWKESESLTAMRAFFARYLQ